MARVIKRGDTAITNVGEPEGDVSPDTGFTDQVNRYSKVISRDRFEARSEAQGIRERASGKADRIMEDAQVQAAEIVSNAQAEAEELRAQAREEGFQEGRSAGATELSETIASASARLSQIEAQAIPQLKELALTIAKKIIGKELQFHPDAVVDIVKQALAEKARQRREIFLRVNPEDLQIIREAKPDLLEVLSRCKEIGLREDPEVARYGVIIETDAGTIDAQLDTQLAVFERILNDG